MPNTAAAMGLVIFTKWIATFPESAIVTEAARRSCMIDRSPEFLIYPNRDRDIEQSSSDSIRIEAIDTII